MNISVIIPVYNAERFLEKAVASALQFEEVKEVLLIEDGSPDGSLQVCEKLLEQHTRVKLYRHPDCGNHGAGATRNLGLKMAGEEFIAFLDADDFYLPNRFDAEKELFKNEKIEGVFGASSAEFLTEKGREEFEKKFKNVNLTTVSFPAEGKDIFYHLLGLEKKFGTFFSLICLTVRAESLQKNQLSFNEDLRVHQDSDFIIKLSYSCYLKSGIINRAIAIRGVHDDNRITKINLYSQAYSERQYLFWKSLHDYFQPKNIEPKYAQHILRQRNAFDIGRKEGIKRYATYFAAVLRDPLLLKTRYRFTVLKK